MRRITLLVTVMAAMLIVVGGTALAITYTPSRKVALKLNKPSFVATAATALYSNAIGPALTIGSDSTDPSATPLSLDTETSEQAPMKVDSESKVDNLNADKLDGKDSEEFIQRNPSAAQNGSIHIDGTMRTDGMLRTGSETGTSQPPNQTGLVVRRINSTTPASGAVLARTDQLRLERDGSFAGLRIAWDANTNADNTVNCMGVSTTEAAVNRHIVPVRSQAAGTAPVFTAEQNVVYATCSFGDSRSASHTTQVT
ncbi:MAG: hypothetical protein AVDCRST_MAG93-9029, partial [uncultured Chloroflexia bacterium]